MTAGRERYLTNIEGAVLPLDFGQRAAGLKEHFSAAARIGPAPDLSTLFLTGSIEAIKMTNRYLGEWAWSRVNDDGGYVWIPLWTFEL